MQSKILVVFILILFPACLWAECSVSFISGELRPYAGIPQKMKVGDFNGDGLDDIVFVSGSTFDVAVAFSNGDGSFSPPNVIFSASPDARIATGYLNGDSNADIVVSLGTGTPFFWIYLSDGSGGFTPIFNPGNIFRAAASTIVDTNGDGINDVVSVGTGSFILPKLRTGFGTGSGSLVGGPELTIGNDPKLVGSGFFSNDMNADVVLSYESSSEIASYRGNGDGTFDFVWSSHYVPTKVPTNIQVTELNGDARNDFIVSYSNNEVGTYVSNFDATFSGTDGFYAGPGTVNAIGSGDFNCDEATDIAVSSNLNEVKLFLNDGSAEFGSALPVAGGGIITGLVVGDFNGDERADIALGLTTGLRILLGEPLFVSGSPLEFADPNPYSTHAYSGPSVRLKAYTSKQVPESTLNLTPSTVVLSSKIEGVAADGVTSIVVRWPVSGAGTAVMSLEDETGGSDLRSVGKIGTLGEPPQSSSVDGLEAIEVDGQWYVFASYTPPLNFDRSFLDNNLFSREIKVSATFSPSQGPITEYRSSERLQLIRPPILFVHGLWGSERSWGLELQHDQRFITYAADYSETGHKSLLSNTSQIAKAARLARRNAHGRGFASTQVTVIGHSMGGLIARLYAANARNNYFNSYNLGQGEFYKLISLYTPHQGSPLACIFETISGWEQAVRRVFTDDVLMSKAVRDLKPNSAAINSLPAAMVPSHTIRGTAGEPTVQLIRDGAALCSKWERRLCPLIYNIAVYVDNVYGLSGMNPYHDLAVNEISAGGQIGGNATTEVTFAPNPNYPYVPIGTHFVSGQHEVGSNYLMPLIFDGVDTDSFAAELPANSSVPVSLVCGANPIPAPSPAPSGQLELTIPEISEVVAGSTIQVEVIASEGFMPELVSVNTDVAISSTSQSAPVTTLDLIIPLDAIGTHQIQGIAFNAEREFLLTDVVTVEVVSDAVLESIQVASTWVGLGCRGEKRKLAVSGVYDQGFDRDLTSSAQGTIYSSADPSIADVSTEGVITAGDVGETTVIIENGIHSTEVSVVVARNWCEPVSCSELADENTLQRYIPPHSGQYRLSRAQCVSL